MNAFERPNFGSIPPVVKNLIIINVILYVASILFLNTFNFRIEDYLGLHVPTAEKFNPFQLISHMFLHAYWSSDQGIMFSHLFFNMFALWMFGRVLEQVWGSKRFLFYYLITGIGAAVIHLGIQSIELSPVIKGINYFMNNSTHENLQYFLNKHFVVTSYQIESSYKVFVESYNKLIMTDPVGALALSKDFLNQYQIDFLNAHVTIGASGAVFGLLLAFGMLFPNTVLMLLFPPIPIKAKYFVMIYGVFELFMGVSNFKFDNVAHFAHLGGMLFGFILIKYWQRRKDIFY